MQNTWKAISQETLPCTPPPPNVDVGETGSWRRGVGDGELETGSVYRNDLSAGSDLVTTFTSSRRTISSADSTRTVRSVVATGGVYKEQGRICCRLVTDDYEAFRIHAASIGSCAEALPVCRDSNWDRRFNVRLDRLRLREVVGGRAVSTIVARVRPRASEGITDLLSPLLSVTCVDFCANCARHLSTAALSVSTCACG